MSESDRDIEPDDLPDVPFCGLEEALRLNAEYEARRAAWRLDHPTIPKID
jgi:hypothetical protein